MRREQKRNQREPQELEKIEKHGMSMASERIAATIGPSYVCGFFAGGFYGLVKEFKKPKPKTRHPLRITIHQYINNVGKSSTYFGNNIGGAILMYILVGKGVNFLFLEELEDFSVPVQNAFNGALTGALYKSTRSRRAMVLGAILGAGAGSFYAYAWGKGYFRFNNK